MKTNNKNTMGMFIPKPAPSAPIQADIIPEIPERGRLLVLRKDSIRAVSGNICSPVSMDSCNVTHEVTIVTDLETYTISFSNSQAARKVLTAIREQLDEDRDYLQIVYSNIDIKQYQNEIK